MNFGPIASIEGYDWAWRAISGVTNAKGLTLLPLAGFPYFLPIPGAVAAGIGIIGGALKIQKGVSKMVEGAQRQDSPATNRRQLAVNGLIDTAVGVGSIVTCGALIAGAGAAVVPVAAATLALGAGRMLFNLGRGIVAKMKQKNVTVDQKLDAMKDTRPNFAGLAGRPAAPAAPAAHAPAAAPAQPAATAAPAQPPVQQAAAPAEQQPAA